MANLNWHAKYVVHRRIWLLLNAHWNSLPIITKGMNSRTALRNTESSWDNNTCCFFAFGKLFWQTIFTQKLQFFPLRAILTASMCNLSQLSQVNIIERMSYSVLSHILVHKWKANNTKFAQGLESGVWGAYRA